METSFFVAPMALLVTIGAIATQSIWMCDWCERSSVSWSWIRLHVRRFGFRYVTVWKVVSWFWIWSLWWDFWGITRNDIGVTPVICMSQDWCKINSRWDNRGTGVREHGGSLRAWIWCAWKPKIKVREGTRS
jgi:hypothetical protein